MTIIGDPALSQEQVSLNSMVKICKHNETTYLLEMTTLFENEGQSTKKKVKSVGLERLLSKYEKVFKMPKELPPVRNREHASTMAAGISPVNIRPYRYSFT